MKISMVLMTLAVGAVMVAPAVAQTTAPATKDESLSTKLSKSDGVIKPKTDVDPGIKVPAPDPHPNSTPVIPPSATGGNSAK